MSAWSSVKKSLFAGRCDYCGERCYGRCCEAHRDLPQLERDLLPRTKKSPPRSLAETSATGSNRKEG